MTAEQLSQAILDAVHRAGLVEVEVSARHVHLTESHVRILFGEEASLTPLDCLALGVDAPLRESGSLAGSGGITLEGPCGTLALTEGVIVAHSHIHVTQPDSVLLDLTDGERVCVALLTERPVVLRDVIIRVGKQFSCKMHIDVDEANAAMIQGFTLGKILR